MHFYDEAIWIEKNYQSLTIFYSLCVKSDGIHRYVHYI